jgi:hypothetical protein
MTPNPDPDSERRRRVRRTAIILALIAVGFYVAFIVMSMTNASHARHRAGSQPPAAAPH